MTEVKSTWLYPWKVCLQAANGTYHDLAMFKSYNDAKHYAEAMHDIYSMLVIAIMYTHDRIEAGYSEVVREF